jgi:hypothetical protein
MRDSGRNTVSALYAKRGILLADIAFLEDMAAGKAERALVAPSLESMQDGRCIEVSGALLATLARDKLPSLKTELAAVQAKIDRIVEIAGQ